MIKRIFNFIIGIFKKEPPPKPYYTRSPFEEDDPLEWMEYSEAANFHYDCGDR